MVDTVQEKKVTVFFTERGDHVCRLSATEDCVFLGFRKFGKRPVCMHGAEIKLRRDREDWIIPKEECPLAITLTN